MAERRNPRCWQAIHRAIASCAWAILLAALPLASSAGQLDEELRCELLYRANIDQEARFSAIRSGISLDDLAKISRTVDAPNAERMRQIVDQHGWPGKSLVGDDGAHAAWLLVQHATHDVELMQRCLALLESAVAAGEASSKDLAYLTDRVRVRQGKRQLYGTQYRDGLDGQTVLEEIEDAEHVDERRRAVGLPSMAEQHRAIEQAYRRK